MALFYLKHTDILLPNTTTTTTTNNNNNNNNNNNDNKLCECGRINGNTFYEACSYSAL